MTKTEGTSAHWSLWVIGAVTLIWNLLGLMNFIMQMNPDTLAQMPEQHRAFAESRPLWATIGFGVAVIFGSLGSVLLLMRRALAMPVLVISFIGVLLSLSHALLLSSAPFEFSGAEFVLTAILPLVIATFLVSYARRGRDGGWLR